LRGDRIAKVAGGRVLHNHTEHFRLNEGFMKGDDIGVRQLLENCDFVHRRFLRARVHSLHAHLLEHKLLSFGHARFCHEEDVAKRALSDRLDLGVCTTLLRMLILVVAI